jgi:hypothetical protein
MDSRRSAGAHTAWQPGATQRSTRNSSGGTALCRQRSSQRQNQQQCAALLHVQVLTLPSFPVSVLGTVVNKRARYSYLRKVDAAESLTYRWAVHRHTADIKQYCSGQATK